MVRQPVSQEVLQYIGVGPVEDHLCGVAGSLENGDDAPLREVEAEASRLPAFRTALEAAWPYPRDPEEMWRRIDIALDRRR